jgi:hypothetical protein
VEENPTVELAETFGAFEEPEILEPKLRSQVACPACHVFVCTQCRTLAHLGECTGSDIPEELWGLLERWKIRRCPKCRAGIRKVYGCSHIECRCGAQFCYDCFKPIYLCEGCEDSDVEDLAEDDIDGRAGFGCGDDLDFGDEPSGAVLGIWGCQHVWSAVTKTSTSYQARVVECHRCFRLVKFKEPPQEVNDDTEMDEDENPYTALGERAWKCFCGTNKCRSCSMEAPSWRKGSVERKWSCDCGKVTCSSCDKAKAHAKMEEENELAWECRCGTIICGACKDSA